MAESKGKKPEFRENPLVAELLAKGADDARVLRGFIGASRDEKYITLYQSLDRLGDTIDIPRDDVLHVIDAPRSNLGAVILWVRNSANVSVRRTQKNSAPRTGAGSRGQEVTKGRLRMNLRPAWGDGVRQSVCGQSVCGRDCISWCDCSICQSICQTLPPN
jgi:hypothetical protein